MRRRVTRTDFVNESVSGWSRLRAGENLSNLALAQRVIWSGRLAGRFLERSAIESGLQRRGDYEVLALLRRVEPTLLTPVEVGHQLLTSPSGMTGKLDRLEQQGLIRRIPDPEDRRAVKLEITDSGRSLIDKAFSDSLDAYHSMLEGFSTVEIHRLGALLDKLLVRLDDLSRAD